MRGMAWEAFQEQHFRPHLVEIEMAESVERQSVTTILKSLVVILGLFGDHAFKHDPKVIRVAFENDIDAGRLGALLRAKAEAPPSEWASKAVVRMDNNALKRIETTIKRFRKRSVRPSSSKSLGAK